MLRKLLLLLAALAAAPASAQVQVTFYSRDFGEVFPHTYFATQGTLSDGRAVPATNYGFTAKSVTPAILLGSVVGEVIAMNDTYVRKSNRHFTLTLDDAAYRRLMAVVEDWRKRPGKSYNLNRANCVHFVRDALQTLGLKTNPKTDFFGKPKSFLNEVEALNPGLN